MKKMRLIVGSLLMMILMISMAGCGGEGEPEEEKPPYVKTGECMNTSYEITIYDEDMDAETAHGILDSVIKEIDRMDGILNHNVEGSEVYQLNNASGERVEVSEDVLDMMRVGILIGNSTNGAFDMSMGSVNELWGFDSDAPKLPDDADIKAALEHVFYGNMATQGNELWLADPEMKLDFTYMANGHIAYAAANIMDESGVKQGKIKIGGTIIMIGEESEGTPWTVDIENIKTGKAEHIGSIQCSDVTVDTVCLYEKTFEQDGNRYHHILDPKTGYPAETDIESATVIVASNYSKYSSILSTTCLLLGSTEAQSFISEMAELNPDMGLNAVFLLKDGTVYKTDGVELITE